MTRMRKATLDDLRRTIDGLDSELVRLLNRRAATAIKIGREKRRRGVPIQDRARERRILTRVRQASRGPLADEAVAGIFKRIVSACRQLQEKDQR